MLKFLEKMILKTALPLLVLSTFGDYDGVRCVKLEENDVKLYNKHRHYDIMHFLNYGINEFDTHNRQCYLAFLIYLNRYLFRDANETIISNDRIEIIDEFSTHISRVMSVEFTSKFYSKTFMLHDEIKVWSENKNNNKSKIAVTQRALEIIEIGLTIYLWNTEKELELLVDYRSDEIPKKFTLKAFETCLNNLRHLATPTKKIGEWCSEEYRVKEYTFFYQMYYKSTEIRDFGALTLFLTEDDFRTLQNANDNKSTNLYIIEYLEDILIEIIQGIVIIFYQVDFVLPRISEVYKFPRHTSIQAELLIILRHLYIKVTDTIQDLYLLFRKFKKKTFISKQYIMFSDFFQFKWTSLFSNAPKIKRTLASNRKQTSENLQSDKFTRKPLFKKATAAEIKKHIEERTSIYDDEIDEPLNEKRFGQFDQIHLSRFYQDRRVQPSLIRFYSVLNDSWNNDVQNETNINQMKVFLYDLNGILTIVKHNVYSLTIASLNTQKKNPSWDTGFINGCQTPQTGPMITSVVQGNYVKKKNLNAQLMEQLKLARIFFDNIQPKNLKPAFEIVVDVKASNEQIRSDTAE